MAKGISWNKWKNNDLVSLKLRDDLYTIGQMLTRPAMRFYKISSHDGKWKNIDLNHIEPLFQVFIGQIVLQKLVAAKIEDETVIPSDAPYQRYWIKPHLNPGIGSYPFKGGKLVDLGPEGAVGTTVAPVIKQNLSVAQDRETIEKYELTGVWGDDHLGDRLRHYFDTGEDYNPGKEKVFPELRSDGASHQSL